MAEKKKDPKFGGKRSLKDTSGNKSIGFEDTFLGDLLGFDGKMGTKGKPGLLASLKGARRKKPGAATTKKKTVVKKKKVIKADPGRQTNPIPINKKPKRNEPGRNTNPIPINTQRNEPGRNTNPIPINKKPKRNEPGRNTNPIPVKPKTPTAAERQASHRRMMKRVTLQAWKDMTPSERTAAGLPKGNQEVFRATGALTLGAGKFTGAFKANRGGLAKKKPVAKMNKGGMTKKSGYAAGGMPMVMKGGKKVPSFAADGVGKMNMGGMAKKKPAAKMMAGGMAKKKPTAKMMGGGMAKSGYMYGGSVTKKKPVTKMNKGGMTKKK